MMYRTEAEYLRAIELTSSAIERVLIIGQDSENNSGGSSHKIQDAELEKLESRLTKLNDQLNVLNNGTQGFFMRSNW